MKKIIASWFALLVLAGANAGTTPPGDGILGDWKTFGDNGKLDSHVEIYKQQGKYFAKIVSLTEPCWPANDDQGMGGKPKNDRYNPQPELRGRPIVGMQFMDDFVYNGDKNIWEDGRIYDPGCGKIYRCKMKLTSSSRLEVRGYIGFSLLGRTDVWMR